MSAHQVKQIDATTENRRAEEPAGIESQPGLEAAPAQRKRVKREVNGWFILDKPKGMTSTYAVSQVKRVFAAKKAGHAGTLDPLATGVLPIALGEATKTVSFVMDGRKLYRFLVRWGIETDTDDAEGRAIAHSDIRPDAQAIAAALPAFTGTIMQAPPRYSAIKIGGERAYDLAREGEVVDLEPRPVEITRLELVAVLDADHAEFEAECGKGTYVRAIARDLGRMLNAFGHVAALRRAAVGPFTESLAVPFDDVRSAQPFETGGAEPGLPLLPVGAGLAGLPAMAVSRHDAARLVRGQPVLLRGRDAPLIEGWVAVSSPDSLVALAEIEQGEMRPRRIFKLAR